MMAGSIKLLLAVLMIAVVTPLSEGGRLLKASRLLKAQWDALQDYNAFTYTSTVGQQPSGLWSIGQDAESTAAPSSKGIRYNGGSTVLSGEVYPTQKSAALTGIGGAKTASGNYVSDNNVNLGLQVVAATYIGARASAGSGGRFTARNKGAVTNDIVSFKAGTSALTGTKGSVSMTDVTPLSASVVGQGNGPVTIATGNEVAAMARSQKSAPDLRQQGSYWNAAHLPGVFGSKPIDSKKRFQSLGACLQCTQGHK